ncbi:hypothetical protein EST38_g14675, partial [Candolleomyces aberdarensis]
DDHQDDAHYYLDASYHDLHPQDYQDYAHQHLDPSYHFFDFYPHFQQQY